MKLTITEATAHARLMKERADQERRELAFERRREFGLYGESALVLMHHVATMTDDDFVAMYNIDKATVLSMAASLETSVAAGDYALRNEVYDFFIEIL